jgi:hypothetical protein
METKMLDLSKAVEAKSDQLNADDLIGGPKVLVITGVKKISGDQPIAISYVDDNGKPYKPCKSMLRVLMAAWGINGEAYVGRSMKVFNDTSVKWAGQEVGGIRISHLSDMPGKLKMALTVTRGKKSQYVVEQLEAKPELSEEQKAIQELLKGYSEVHGVEKTRELVASLGVKKSSELPEGSLEKVMEAINTQQEAKNE